MPDRGRLTTPGASLLDGRDPQVLLDLLARHMWIAERLAAGEDGVDAAEAWDEDRLLTDTYERFEALAQEAAMAEAKRNQEQAAEAGYGD